MCPRGDLNTQPREISPDRGKSCRQDSGAMPVRVKLVLPRCDRRGRVIYVAGSMLSHMAGHCHAGQSAVAARDISLLLVYVKLVPVCPRGLVCESAYIWSRLIRRMLWLRAACSSRLKPAPE